MDELKNPALEAFEDASKDALPENPLLGFTKTQIGKLMADGALLASLRQHGVTADSLSEAVVANTKLNYTVQASDLSEITLNFDPSKNGIHISAKFKF